MYLDWHDLPPNAAPESYGRGGVRYVKFCKVQRIEQGPVVLDRREGGYIMRYMCGHFVFDWVEGQPTVKISHGDPSRKPRGFLPWEPKIRGPFRRGVLRSQASAWVARHLRQARPPET